MQLSSAITKFEAQYILHLGCRVLNHRIPARRFAAYPNDILEMARFRTDAATETGFRFVELLDEKLQKSMGDSALSTYLLMDDKERMVALRSMCHAGIKVAKLTGTPLYEDWELKGKPDFTHHIDIELFTMYVHLADMEIFSDAEMSYS